MSYSISGDEPWELQAQQEEEDIKNAIKVVKSIINTQAEKMEVIRKNPIALKYASDSIKRDQSFFLDCTTLNREADWIQGDMITVFHYAADEILENEAIMLEALRTTPIYFNPPPTSFTVLFSEAYRTELLSTRYDWYDCKYESLYWFTKTKNMRQLKQAIALDTEIAQTKPGKDSILVQAINSNDISVFNLILDQVKGIDLNEHVTVFVEGEDEPEFYTTPLMSAAKIGNIQMLQTLLSLGAKMNVKNQLGQNAIYLAFIYQHPECVRLLLEHGANSDMILTDDATVSAHRDQNYELISLLSKIRSYSDAEITSRLASSVGYSEKYFMHLLDCFQDKNKINYSPAFLAAVKYDKPDILNKLVAKGVNIDYTSKDDDFPKGSTGLLIAVIKGNVKMVERLLALGCDQTIKNSKGETPVSYIVNGYVFCDTNKAMLRLLDPNHMKLKPTHIKREFDLNNTNAELFDAEIANTTLNSVKPSKSEQLNMMQKMISFFTKTK